MNKIAENQIANYFLDKKIEARTILSNSFNMICEKILLQNNEAFVVKYYQNKKNEFNSIISEKNSLSYLANITSLVPKIKFNSNELLIIDYIENNDIKDKNYQVILAEVISKIHQNTNNRYGFQFDAQIGALKQTNEFTDNWVIFFRDKRLNSIFELINNNNPMASHINQRIEKLLKNIHNFIPNNPIPRLLHGDLWAGNIICEQNHLKGFIDPAIYFANPEIELAFSTLFSTFNHTFFDRYKEHRIINPGFFEERRHVYNLYPLLVHLRLFGVKYLTKLEKILTRLGV